jgi:hypothetical protein
MPGKIFSLLIFFLGIIVFWFSPTPHHFSNGSFQKRSILPPRRKFLPSRGGGEKKLFLIIVSVLGHPKGVGGLNSYFLRGGGMDVFWNDPIGNKSNNY